MKLINKNIIHSFFKTKFCLVLILFLLFTGDSLTKIYLNKTLNFSWIAKVIISLLLLTNLFFLNKKNFNLLAILFCGLLLGMAMNFQNDFIEKTSLFFEYTSGIMFFNFLIINQNKLLLSKLLLYVFSFYIVTVLAGSFFEIDFLRTYNASRFGYMPLFSSQNEFSFIMISIVVFFYKRWLGKQEFYNSLFLFLSLITALLTGTKVVYIFLLIFINYILIRNFKVKKTFIFYILTGLLVFYLKDELFLLFIDKFEIFVDIYLEKGLLDTISSLRLSYLNDRLICQTSRMEFINYLFGGMTIKCITEMSFFDIILFFGFIGGGIYVYLYIKHVFKKLHLDSFGVLFILSFIILSFLGGYYFENFSSQFYTISVLFIFYYIPAPLSQNIEVKE